MDPSSRNEPAALPAEATAGPSADLVRFVVAQEHHYARALAEIRAGRKETCWIWYVFPQFLDPQRASSVNNRRFQIRSQDEAVKFLKHPVLGPRYLEISQAVSAQLQGGSALETVLGGAVDAKKLHQSVTVFRRAALRVGNEEAAALLCAVLDGIQATRLSAPRGDERGWEEPEMVRQWDSGLFADREAQASPVMEDFATAGMKGANFLFGAS